MASIFIFDEKSPKADTAQIFWQKSPFLLKSIHQTAPRFKEGVASCMLTGYTFNAPGKKYHGLGELGLNLYGHTRPYCDTYKMKKKRLLKRVSHNGTIPNLKHSQ
jgi:hypothetical protein